MTKVKKSATERASAQVDLSKNFHAECLKEINSGKRKISVGRFLSKRITVWQDYLLKDPAQFKLKDLTDKLRRKDDQIESLKRQVNTKQSQLVRLQDQKNEEVQNLRDQKETHIDRIKALEGVEDSYLNAGFFTRLKYLFTGKI